MGGLGDSFGHGRMKWISLSRCIESLELIEHDLMDIPWNAGFRQVGGGRPQEITGERMEAIWVRGQN